MSSLGVKRPAPPSSAEDSVLAKKQKTDAAMSMLDPSESASDASGLDNDLSDSADVDVSVVPAAAPSVKPEAQQTKPTAKGGKKKTSNAVPVKELFDAWKEPLPKLPSFNNMWGQKPMPGPNGPQSRPNELPARTSNAQTNPPLWEDRKWRYKKGSQLVKSFRKGDPVDENGPDLDQADNLLLHLIDMRPKSKKDRTPRRLPVYYRYENGTPKNWDDKQTIKALNDRRQQAIDRVTCDAPWTHFEREHLASILRDFPDASILEITERFNWRFKGKDSAKSTMFDWDYISTGRTIECVRHEYLTYQHLYDQGQAPRKKELVDKTQVNDPKYVKPRMDQFGKHDKDLDHVGEDDDSDAEGEGASPKKRGPKKAASKKKIPKRQPSVTIESKPPTEDEGEVEDDPYSAAEDSEASIEVPKMSGPAEEELLELAGYNASDLNETDEDSGIDDEPGSDVEKQQIDPRALDWDSGVEDDPDVDADEQPLSAPSDVAVADDADDEDDDDDDDDDDEL